MPFSIVHIEIGTKLKNHFKEENDFLDFLAGSILADCSYNLENRGVFLGRNITHYHFKEDYFLSDFDRAFKEKELKTNNSPFLLGYYAHLILDKVWSNSDFVGKTLKNHEMEKIYQISRFFYSHNDLEKFLKSISNQKIIDKIINYKLESHKLPSIYNSFDIDLLNDVFSEIVDYALEKKFFEKLENTKDYYIYKNGKIEITNIDLYNKIYDYFPLETYNSLKDIGFEKIKTGLESAIKT